jgi:hypothetical protein
MRGALPKARGRLLDEAWEGHLGMSMTSDNGYYVNFLVQTKKWPGSTLNWNRA